MANLQSLDINDTGFIEIPRGTTSQRPANPQVGYIRFNTSIGKIEVYNGNSWQNAPPVVSASGAFSTTSLYGYDVIAFTGNGTLTVESGGEVEYLIVGGGGGGGTTEGGGASGAGGGAGGVLYGKTNVSAGSYSVTVGTGGTAPFEASTNGGDSSIFGITALGGGAGGSRDVAGSNGGSGGGTQTSSFGSSNFGLGTPGQGNRGGSGDNGSSPSSGGGGGGAGGPGEDGKTLSFRTDLGGRGGPGLYYGDIFSENFGENGWFGGGGGGGNGSSTYRAFGGIGGGGNGGDANGTTSSGTNGEPGLANTGGGGGGGPVEPIDGGPGGSGIVIIRYRISTPFQPISANGGTVTDVRINGRMFREHVFSGNSNYDFSVGSLGTTDGLVSYEIVADGASGDRADTVDLGYLQGEILRKIDPFLDSNTIFEHTSAQSAPVSGWSNAQNSEPLDDTVTSQAQINGACRSDDFAGALANHYADVGRMPTLEEYINDATKGSGCGHDSDLCWTVTKGANTSEHWIARGDQDDSSVGDSRPESNGGTFFLRQVADTDINRPDPVILQDDLVLAEIQASGHPFQIVDGPKVQAGTTYNLLLGSGVSNAIPHTGKQSTNSVSGISNKGTVVIRYPLEPL